MFPFNWIGDLFQFFFKKTPGAIVRYFRTSIRLQLIVTFVICSVCAVIVYAVGSSLFGSMNRVAFIDYSGSTFQMEEAARLLVNRIDDLQNRKKSSSSFDAGARTPAANPAESQDADLLQQIQAMIDRESMQGRYKILLVDDEGKVMMKSTRATETTVDLHNIIRNAMDSRNLDASREFVSFYPIDFNSRKAYLIFSGMPEPTITYRGRESPLSLPIALVTFVGLFYFLTKRKMKYIEELSAGLKEIAKGNLDYRVQQKSQDELGSLAGHINQMAEELKRKIEEERRAEQTKNELITNVSHDLRTPLTLIMGYLRLLKDKNYSDPQQADNYINISYGKAEKLKVLIEDLFEYTKLSNEGVRMHRETVCLNELLDQLLEELVSYCEENRLRISRQLPYEKIMVTVDPDKIIRVFENLLSNAVKYSYKPGVIGVRMTKEAPFVTVCVSNQGAPLSPEELERLFDRFYRVDASRSSETGGSGLGLAIAKSIVESHDGEIWAESEGEEIRFYVKMKLAA